MICRIRNQMKVTLLNIKIDDVDAGYASSGVCTFLVNNKVVQVIVHPAGELDFECVGDVLNDEEQDVLIDAFNTSSEVNKAFPADQY